MRGAKGWRPKELSQLLTGMEKEVAQLRPDGLTPAQEKEVRELMNRYYEQKFSEWSRLHKIDYRAPPRRDLNQEPLYCPPRVPETCLPSKSPSCPLS